jgi:glycosyltransferase involved in cell wall biosynthesis
MKRFLFVTYHFPPSVGGGIPRILSFARDVSRYGWVASVLTSTSHGAAAIDSSALSSLPVGTQVSRAYCPLARAGTRGHERVRSGWKGAARQVVLGASRLAMVPEPLAPWIPFALDMGWRALEGEPHGAVVATYGPPANLIVGAALARLSGLPLLIDYRDLWTDLPFARHATPVHSALLHALERTIVRAASAVTTVSEGMSRHIAERFGIAADRVITIVNGFDEAALELVRDRRDTGKRPFTLCYSGSVYAMYDVGPFVRALRRLADTGEITPETFRFRTLGSFPTDVIAREGLTAFHDREGFLPRDAMFERFADADAFVAIEGGDYGARMGYPVKVFDYLLTGKPILGIVVPGGNCARLLREMGMNELPENREDAIAASLSRLLQTHGRVPAPVRVDLPPLSQFRRDHNAAALAGLLDQVAGSKIGRPIPVESRYGSKARS